VPDGIRRRPATMSLRLRLGLWYGALTGAVVLMVSALTYANHTHALYTHLDEALLAAAHAVAAADARPPGHGQPSPHISIRLHGAAGGAVTTLAGAVASGTDTGPSVDPRAVLAHPAGPPYDPLVEIGSPLGAVPPGRGAFGLASDSAGRRWRLYVLPASDSTATATGTATATRAGGLTGPPATGRGEGYVVALAPLDQIDDSVEEFRRLEPVLAAGGAAAALVSGWLLAGRALRPLAAVTETAGAIARSGIPTRRVPTGPAARHDELGLLASTFNEMLDSIERAGRAQQRFVADASHELRAPLTGITANLELLERAAGLPEVEKAQVIAEASGDARRLARLVEDLLALARADAGVRLRRERVDLDRVLLDAVADARHLARGPQVSVDDLEPVVVEGDAERLRQVFLVLLDNALKYTPAEGNVGVVLRPAGNWVEVQVRDSGIGIAPADLPHVFERFYRADPARTRDPGGTGLGLSIARWIAGEHGGRISLRSVPGAGTTATVLLPRARQIDSELPAVPGPLRQ
jgi:two-component system, OmpR family, sensor kinase